MAGKVSVGLSESNGCLPLGLSLISPHQLRFYARLVSMKVSPPLAIQSSKCTVGNSDATNTDPRSVFVDVRPVLVELGDVGMLQFNQVVEYLLQLFLYHTTPHAHSHVTLTTTINFCDVFQQTVAPMALLLFFPCKNPTCIHKHNCCIV